MKKESYIQIAVCAMRNADGNGLLLDIPLYIKVSEINAKNMLAMQDEMLDRVSQEMMRRYEKQISQHMTNLRKEVHQNEIINNVSCRV